MQKNQLAGALTALVSVGTLFSASCSSSSNGGFGSSGSNGDGGPSLFLQEGGDTGPLAITDCKSAAAAKSYAGCDYWPTVTANPALPEIFDFAIVLSNPGVVTAKVTVTGPAGFTKDVLIEPQSIQKVYLPWVEQLVGTRSCLGANFRSTTRVNGGAYHVVSSVPIVAYQFNPIEYSDKGGPAGKNWARCSSVACGDQGCFSYTNDASLLLPSTAMTGTYRVISSAATSYQGSNLTITGTQDDTSVTLELGSKGSTTAGGGLSAGTPGGNVTFNLNAGDVIEFASNTGADLSGSIVRADKPVQSITGMPCVTFPEGTSACDHVEESLFPAESLGKNYAVIVPTSPGGKPIGHIVRMVGNVDGTTLTYLPSRPPSCPATLNAGQVQDCGRIASDFQVTGDHEFAIASFQLSAGALNSTFSPKAPGDPSQTTAIPVEQYRSNYLFLAPDDYEESYVDIIGPADAAPALDGNPITTIPTKISGSDLGVYRVRLKSSNSGSHTLTAAKPIGIQVQGYGAYTSYGYPGGLDLRIIAAPPR